MIDKITTFCLTALLIMMTFSFFGVMIIIGKHLADTL